MFTQGLIRVWASGDLVESRDQRPLVLESMSKQEQAGLVLPLGSLHTPDTQKHQSRGAPRAVRLVGPAGPFLR